MSARGQQRAGGALAGLALVAGLAGCVAGGELGNNAPCAADEVRCPRGSGTDRTECVDPQYDERNCGACGVRCGDGAACQRGRCCATPTCGGGCAGERFEARSTLGEAESFMARFADLDGDGLDDAIFPAQYGGTLSVVWGSRDGAMGPRVVLTSGRTSTYPTTEDIDGDGVRDLSIVRRWFDERDEIYTVGVELFFGDGRRGFVHQPILEFPREERVDNAFWQDLDGDGDTDLLTRSVGLRCLAVRLNEAGPRARPRFGAPRCLMASDVGYDSKEELYFLARDEAGRTHWLERIRRTGVGTFLPLTHLVLSRDGAALEQREELPDALPDDTYVIHFERDLDGDGRRDLLTLRPASDRRPGVEFALYLQRAFNRFERCYAVYAENQVDAVASGTMNSLGDFNGDGLLDAAGAVTCGYCPSRLYVLLRR